MQLETRLKSLENKLNPPKESLVERLLNDKTSLIDIIRSEVDDESFNPYDNANWKDLMSLNEDDRNKVIEQIKMRSGGKLPIWLFFYEESKNEV